MFESKNWPEILEKISAQNVLKKFGPSLKKIRPKMYEKFSIPITRKISECNARIVVYSKCSKKVIPKCLKTIRTEIFGKKIRPKIEKFSTQNVRKNLDWRSSKKSKPECSKNFRLEIFEKISARNVRKKSIRNVRKNCDPECSKSFRTKFEKDSQKFRCKFAIVILRIPFTVFTSPGSRVTNHPGDFSVEGALT